MKNSNDNIVQRNGKTYYYSAERDAYYCGSDSESVFSKYAWIPVTVVLVIVVLVTA